LKHIPGSNAFCVPGKYDNGSEDETDIRPRHAVMFPGFAGAGKSVSSSYPLSYFGTTKSVRTRHIQVQVQDTISVNLGLNLALALALALYLHLYLYPDKEQEARARARARAR